MTIPGFHFAIFAQNYQDYSEFILYVSGTSKESSDAPSLFAAFPSLSSCQTYVNHRIGRGYLLKVLVRTFHIRSSWVVQELTIIQSKTSNSFWVHKAQRFPATPVIATSSEPVIRMPQGNSSNCERTSIRGVPWVTTRQVQHDRPVVLVREKVLSCWYLSYW